jgi:hypothetical protein
VEGGASALHPIPMRTAQQQIEAKLAAGVLITGRDVRALERQLSNADAFTVGYADLVEYVNRIRPIAYYPVPLRARLAVFLGRALGRAAALALRCVGVLVIRAGVLRGR